MFPICHSSSSKLMAFSWRHSAPFLPETTFFSVPPPLGTHCCAGFLSLLLRLQALSIVSLPTWLLHWWFWNHRHPYTPSPAMELEAPHNLNFLPLQGALPGMAPVQWPSSYNWPSHVGDWNSAIAHQIPSFSWNAQSYCSSQSLCILEHSPRCSLQAHCFSLFRSQVRKHFSEPFHDDPQM